MENNGIILANDKNIHSLVKSEITKLGIYANLNHIDVSQITDMTELFFCYQFNGDISKWDIRNVKHSDYMFRGSKFNGDISNWKFDNLVSANEMFMNSEFNGDLSKWNVSKLMSASDMFFNSKFNGDISNWRFNADILIDEEMHRVIKHSNEIKLKKEISDLKDGIKSSAKNKFSYSL